MIAFLDYLKWALPLIFTVATWLYNESQKREAHKLDIKRKACLAALDIVDSYYSNLTWTNDKGEPIDCEKQEKASIKEVRNIYNNLVLTCDNNEILNEYKKCLGIYGTPNTNNIIKLRNLIRTELNFGKIIEDDINKSWIARINN